eukprot:m.30467 g.30467  ORF g.30467 m.30467 type:complete len:164 (-) comp16290_c0_seq1:273-764(-)
MAKIVKGTVKFAKVLLGDWKTSFMDTAKYGKENPLKFGINCTLLGGGCLLYASNITKQTYQRKVAMNMTKLRELPQDCWTDASIEFMPEIDKLRQMDKLRYLNLAVATIVYAEPYSDRLSSFTAKHWTVLGAVSHFREKIKDVSLCGKTFYLDKAMKNYDENY